MFCTRALPLLLALSYFHTIFAWQQSDSAEYNDDSIAMMPGSAWKDNLEKRNTWWTKKSVQNEDIGGCSIEKCMHMLLECLRRAETKVIFLHCKDSHLSCLASCFQKYREKFLFNTVAMAS